MDNFQYFMPTKVVFAPGAFDSLGGLCEHLGEKALLVTGKRSARASGALERICTQLAGAAVFDQVEENPTTATCERGRAFCRENGCDFVVALGGGSPMDAAKTIAMLVRNEGPCNAYFGRDLFKCQPLPVVTVPTTAGTGSEVTPYAVLVDEKKSAKAAIKGAGLFPRIAVLDPELSLTMPRNVTLNTGIDALSQAMEGMVARNSSALGDVLALDTIRLVKQWLPRAVADGHDLEARAQMLFAAMLSGCVIAQSGTTLVHGMGYLFTTGFGVAHGLANGFLLTPVFQFNAWHAPAKVAAMADALGFPAEPTPADAAAKIGAAVHALFKELGVSAAAKDAGVDGNRLDWCTEKVWSNRGRFANQIGEPSRDDVARMYRQAWEGAAYQPERN